jgi:hypothetical protein
MQTVVLWFAIWNGATWNTMPYEKPTQTIKQCEYIGEKALKKFKRVRPNWTVHYRCTKRQEV